MSSLTHARSDPGVRPVRTPPRFCGARRDEDTVRPELAGERRGDAIVTKTVMITGAGSGFGKGASLALGGARAIT